MKTDANLKLMIMLCLFVGRMEWRLLKIYHFELSVLNTWNVCKSFLWLRINAILSSGIKLCRKQLEQEDHHSGAPVEWETVKTFQSSGSFTIKWKIKAAFFLSSNCWLTFARAPTPRFVPGGSWKSSKVNEISEWDVFHLLSRK